MFFYHSRMRKTVINFALHLLTVLHNHLALFVCLFSKQLVKLQHLSNTVQMKLYTWTNTVNRTEMKPCLHHRTYFSRELIKLYLLCTIMNKIKWTGKVRTKKYWNLDRISRKLRLSHDCFMLYYLFKHVLLLVLKTYNIFISNSG